MNPKLIENIANAVLYEGYMLYPYRRSSVKNRQRWNFGVVYPKSYSEIQKGTDAWFMQTQCLIRGDESAVVDTKVRFLHAVSSQTEELPSPVAEFAEQNPMDFEIVESLDLGKNALQSWQETIERNVNLPPFRLADLLTSPAQHSFSFSGARQFETVKNESGAIAAYIVRTRERISGCVQIGAEKCNDGLFKVTVLLSNAISVEAPQLLSRDEVMLLSLVSAHTILGVTGGEFISLIDPPAEFKESAAACKNVGTWPVLAGEENSRDAMLSSPIILYDYPQIAPESPGDLFDGTEIDEILSLRIMTLSDDEKREIRQSDDRAREVLDRTENMPVEHFLKLHGALRGMKPADATGDASGADGGGYETGNAADSRNKDE